MGSVPVGMVEADIRAAVKGFTLRAEVALAFIGDTTALEPAAHERQRRASCRRSGLIAASRWVPGGRL